VLGHRDQVFVISIRIPNDIFFLFVAPHSSQNDFNSEEESSIHLGEFSEHGGHTSATGLRPSASGHWFQGAGDRFEKPWTGMRGNPSMMKSVASGE
jgi:hypothetical protein